MATLYVKVAGGNASNPNTWSNVNAGGVDNSGPPTSSDNCIAELASGNLTIDAATSMNSFSTTAGTGSWGGTLTHNAFILTISGSVVFNSGMTYTPLATSTIIINGTSTITSAGLLFPLLTISAATTLGDNLNFIASKVITLICTGNFLDLNGKTISGNSLTNRILVSSNTLGTARTITINSGTFSNCDFRDITASTALDLSAGSSGNCGGCTNITFTTAIPKFAVAAGNFSNTAVWSLSNGGASGAAVPLPQDSITINSNSSVGTITQDMPRTGTGIDCTGYTGTLAISIVITTYGNWTQASGMTSSGAGTITFEGRGIHTVTSNGKTFGQRLIFSSFGGTYSLNDAINSINSAFTITNGTFTSNGFSITCLIFTGSGGSTRTINLGASTVTISSNGSNPFDNTTVTNLTWNAGTSIILFSDNVSSKTFIGGGLVYYNLAITGGGAGTQTITGANTFNRITVTGGAKSVILPGSTTTTIISGQGLGNGTNIITFTASAGSASISKSSGIVSWNYVNLTNIPSTGGATFYAGGSSVDGGGNTNWIFRTSPSNSGAFGGGSFGSRAFELGAFGTSPFSS